MPATLTTEVAGDADSLLRLAVTGKPPLVLTLAQWYALGQSSQAVSFDSGSVESSDSLGVY